MFVRCEVHNRADVKTVKVEKKAAKREQKSVCSVVIFLKHIVGLAVLSKRFERMFSGRPSVFHPCQFPSGCDWICNSTAVRD